MIHKINNIPINYKVDVIGVISTHKKLWTYLNKKLLKENKTTYKAIIKENKLLLEIETLHETCLKTVIIPLTEQDLYNLGLVYILTNYESTKNIIKLDQLKFDDDINNSIKNMPISLWLDEKQTVIDLWLKKTPLEKWVLIEEHIYKLEKGFHKVIVSLLYTASLTREYGLFYTFDEEMINLDLRILKETIEKNDNPTKMLNYYLDLYKSIITPEFQVRVTYETTGNIHTIYNKADYWFIKRAELIYRGLCLILEPQRDNIQKILQDTNRLLQLYGYDEVI